MFEPSDYLSDLIFFVENADDLAQLDGESLFELGGVGVGNGAEEGLPNGHVGIFTMVFYYDIFNSVDEQIGVCRVWLTHKYSCWQYRWTGWPASCCCSC